MLALGVKRKRDFSEEKEDVEETDRKQYVNDATGYPSATTDLSYQRYHQSQRQLLMSLCLDKLHRYQPGSEELRLHRSVLLVNTLRRVQQDMQHDSTLDVSIQLSSYSSSTLSFSSSSSSHCSTSQSDLSDSLYEFLLGNVVLHTLRDCVREEDFSQMCVGCAEEEARGAQFGGAQFGGFSSPSQPESSLCLSHGSGFSERTRVSQSPTMLCTDSLTDTEAPAGYLCDLALEENDFEDIDTSMYDNSDRLPALTVHPFWAGGLSSSSSSSSWDEEQNVKDMIWSKLSGDNTEVSV